MMSRSSRRWHGGQRRSPEARGLEERQREPIAAGREALLLQPRARERRAEHRPVDARAHDGKGEDGEEILERQHRAHARLQDRALRGERGGGLLGGRPPPLLRLLRVEPRRALAAVLVP